MNKVKSFQEFISEGEADMAKPLAGEERPGFEDDSNEDHDQVFSEIKDRLTGCIDSLEELHKALEGTKLSQDKIDNIIADLKSYLKNVEAESDISHKSNHLKED